MLRESCAAAHTMVLAHAWTGLPYGPCKPWHELWVDGEIALGGIRKAISPMVSASVAFADREQRGSGGQRVSVCGYALACTFCNTLSRASIREVAVCWPYARSVVGVP